MTVTVLSFFYLLIQILNGQHNTWGFAKSLALYFLFFLLCRKITPALRIPFAIASSIWWVGFGGSVVPRFKEPGRCSLSSAANDWHAPSDFVDESETIKRCDKTKITIGCQENKKAKIATVVNWIGGSLVWKGPAGWPRLTERQRQFFSNQHRGVSVTETEFEAETTIQ